MPAESIRTINKIRLILIGTPASLARVGIKMYFPVAMSTGKFSIFAPGRDLTRRVHAHVRVLPVRRIFDIMQMAR